MAKVVESLEELTHSEQWTIGKTVTRKELQRILVNVLGFYSWATWGNYIGFWKKSPVPQWKAGYLEDAELIERCPDFAVDKEKFVIAKKYEYMPDEMKIAILLDALRKEKGLVENAESAQRND